MSCWPQVICVGHNCLDTLCQVEAYPPEDGSTHITSMTECGGGAAATAAVAAVRLGVSAGVVGLLGDDDTGKKIRALLETEKVSTQFIRTFPGGRSSVSYVMVDPRRNTRTKFPYPDDLPEIGWDRAQTDAVTHARVLHLDGTRYGNALTAAQIAKKAGVLISLDGCHMEKDNEKNRVLAAMSDILIMNYRYPVMVSGIDNYSQALLEMASWGPRVVIGTRGAQGCLAVVDGKVLPFEAYPVAAADTTGAGDVFHGAFLAGMLQGMNLPDSIRLASAAAALKCRKIGGRAGIPSMAEALEFLRERS